MKPSEAADLVKALAPLCKAEGIRRVRVGEVELEFAGGAPVDEKLLERFNRAFERGTVSDNDGLWWSVPGYVPESERETPPGPPKTARGRKA